MIDSATQSCEDTLHLLCRSVACYCAHLKYVWGMEKGVYSPVKFIEYGVYEDLITIYPTPYSIYLRRTIYLGRGAYAHMHIHHVWDIRCMEGASRHLRHCNSISIACKVCLSLCFEIPGRRCRFFRLRARIIYVSAIPSHQC